MILASTFWKKANIGLSDRVACGVALAACFGAFCGCAAGAPAFKAPVLAALACGFRSPAKDLNRLTDFFRLLKKLGSNPTAPLVWACNSFNAGMRRNTSICSISMDCK